VLGGDLDEVCYVPLSRAVGGCPLQRRRLAWAFHWRCHVARFVSPPGSNGDRRPGSPPLEVSAFGAEHPAIWEYLTLAQHDTGTPRETSTLTLFVDEGRLKAVLRDRDACQALFATGPTVEELLASLEGMLTDHLADWRSDKASGFKRR